MHQEEYRGLPLLAIDPEDSLSSILDRVCTLPRPLLLLISSLDVHTRQAFVSADDFAELYTHGKSEKLFLILPDAHMRQWARESGFTLIFPSIEDILLKSGLFPEDTGEMAEKQCGSHARSAPRSFSTPSWTLSPALQRSNRRMMVLLLGLSLITVIVGSLFVAVRQSAMQVSQPLAAQPKPDGEAHFQSSRNYNQDGSSGVNDQLRLTLHHLAPPPSGKAYYAWLLSDRTESEMVSQLLGKLAPQQGTVIVTFTDPQGHNLLASWSRLLITEEDATVTPLVPSPDQVTWRVSGMLPQPPANDHDHPTSFLDNLRDLLANDPVLEPLGLHGGLDVWQYRECAELAAWTQLARDGWDHADPSDLRQHLLTLITNLDGLSSVSRDIPAGMSIPTTSPMEQVGLIDMLSNQPFPSYLTLLGRHLQSLALAPGVTAQQKYLIPTLTTALNGIGSLLQQARMKVKTLLSFSDEQLRQPDAGVVLNDLVNLTNDAYAGTDQQQGSAWLHQHLEALATFALQSV